MYASLKYCYCGSFLSNWDAVVDSGYLSDGEKEIKRAQQTESRHILEWRAGRHHILPTKGASCRVVTHSPEASGV